MKKYSIALALISAIVSTGAIVNSAKAQFNSPHKYTDSVTSKTYVYIPGQPVGLAIPNLASTNDPSAESLRLDDCGWGSTEISSVTTQNIQFYGGGVLNWTGRTKGAAPTCSAAKVSSMPNAAIGDVIITGKAAWIKGGNTWGSKTLLKTYGFVIKSKANACGFVRVLLTEDRTMKNFKVGTTDYTLATLPEVTKPQICRTVAGNKIKYVPLQ